MKNPFKRKKEKFPTASVPRSMSEIQKAYAETVARAGQAQYQVFVFTEELRQANLALVSINREAAERQNLDKQAAAAQPVAETKPAAPAEQRAAQ